MHLAITGNIGSGKTTLTKLLSKHFGWEAQYETLENNPYISSFYDDMHRWSFHLQIYFLNTRFRQILELRKTGKNIIQDRTIYEDAYIFAPALHDMGLMSSRDFENYFSLFEIISNYIQAPDLLIYLRASVPTLVNQIQKRGRKYELSIKIDYLQQLNNRYEEWANNYNKGKILIIDIDKLNFEENPNDLGDIINKVNTQVFSLFKS
jgi:hypothetical protein